jgi:2-keto-4-pentenoate hydratase
LATPASSAERELASVIAGARASRTTIEASDEISLDAAYRVQQLLGGGRPIRGRKVGMVSPAKRAQFGMTEALHGPVYEEMFLDGTVGLDEFIQPRLEPELAVVLAEDVPADAAPGDVARAIEGTFLAVDILDTVWADYRVTPGHGAADGVNCGAFLLGDRLLPLEAGGALELMVDGDPLASGPVSALGDPIARCGWLSRSVGGLRAGEVVFLGSPAANVAARPGLLEVIGPDGAYLTAQLVGAA